MTTHHDRGRSRALLHVAVIALSGLALAACATVPAAGPSHGAGAGPGGSGDPGTSTVPFDPTTLVGHWTIEGADDEWSGTVAQFDYELTLWRECGNISFAYIVGPTGDLHVSGPQSWSGTCGDAPVATWITDATTLAQHGDDIVFLASDGHTTATLHRGGTPHVDKNTSPDLAVLPVLTPELKAQLTWTPVTLQAGLSPATVADLTQGTWFPIDPPASNADGSWGSFSPDGTWSGRDGCNETSGTYVLAADGGVRTTSGMSTLIGCDGVDVGSWITQAQALGTADDGATLVLLDAHGAELGRLVQRA